MDKIRAFLRIAIQQRFWILSLLSIGFITIFWMLSAGAIDDEYAEKRKDIDNKFSSMKQLNSKTFYANTKVIEDDRKQTVELRNNVLEVWKELYDRQRQEVLYWPELLGNEFVETIDKLDFGDSIKADMCGHF